MTSHQTPNRLGGRTKIITAASVGAAGLAGLFAIGANLGILSSADQSAVGTVSAAGDLIPSETRIVDVYLDQQGNPQTTTAGALPGAQRFTVDAAGAVDVSVGPDGAQLDLVSPASGWTAMPVATTDADVAVTFTDGARTLQFSAVAGPGGTVTGDLTEPSAALQASSYHDDDDDHDDDDYDYDDRDDHDKKDRRDKKGSEDDD